MTTGKAPSATESVLAKIWQEVLGIERVEPTDNFFTLGGNSLAAMRMVKRADAMLGISVPLRAVFDHPVLMELAGYCDRTIGAVATAQVGVID